MAKSTSHPWVLVAAVAIMALALSAVGPVLAHPGAIGANSQGGTSIALQSGDTLGTVVSRYNLSGSDLRNFFTQNTGLVLQPGQTITFPPGVTVNMGGAAGQVTETATAAAGGLATATSPAGVGTETATAAAGGVATGTATAAAGGVATETPSAGGAVTETATAAAGGLATGTATAAAGGLATETPTVAGGVATGTATAAAGGLATGTPTVAGGVGTETPTAAAGGLATGTATAAAGVGAAQETGTPAATVGAGTPTAMATVGVGTPTAMATVGVETPTAVGTVGAGTPTAAATVGVETPTAMATVGVETPTAVGTVAAETPTSAATVATTPTTAAGGGTGTSQTYTTVQGDTLGKILGMMGFPVSGTAGGATTGTAPTDAQLEEFVALNSDLQFESGQTAMLPAGIPQTGQGNVTGTPGTPAAGVTGTPGANQGTYTVQAGDTLEDIANRYGITVQQLLQMNPNLLQPGMTINVPGGTGTPGAIPQTGNQAERTFTVQNQETLSSLISRYGLGTNDMVAFFSANCDVPVVPGQTVHFPIPIQSGNAQGDNSTYQTKDGDTLCSVVNMMGLSLPQAATAAGTATPAAGAVGTATLAAGAAGTTTPAATGAAGTGTPAAGAAGTTTPAATGAVETATPAAGVETATPAAGAVETATPAAGAAVETATPAAGAVETATPLAGVETATPATGVETATPAAGVVETATPAAGAVETATPAAGVVETATPAAGVETATPVAGAVETATPAAGVVETATPAAGAVETATPAAGAVETATPAAGAAGTGTPAATGGAAMGAYANNPNALLREFVKYNPNLKLENGSTVTVPAGIPQTGGVSQSAGAAGQAAIQAQGQARRFVNQQGCPSAPAGSGFYISTGGESFQSIADKFDVTVQQVMDRNPGVLSVSRGQVVMLPGVEAPGKWNLQLCNLGGPTAEPSR